MPTAYCHCLLSTASSPPTGTVFVLFPQKIPVAFYRAFVALIFISFSFFCEAQELRAGLGARVMLKKKFIFKGELEHRSQYSPFETKNLFTEFNLGYRIIPSLEVRGSYRYRFLPSDIAARSRYASMLIYRFKSDSTRVDISARAMYQKSYNRIDDEFRDAVRVLGELGYSIKRNRPFISVEGFMVNRDPFYFSRLRTTLGFGVSVIKPLELIIYYRRDDVFDKKDGYERTEYIAGITLNYKIKNRGASSPPAPLIQTD